MPWGPSDSANNAFAITPSDTTVFGGSAFLDATNRTQVPRADNSTAPNVTLRFCKLDGKKFDSNVGVAGPWSGAAIYANSGAALNIYDTLITGCGYDGIKTTNCAMTATNLYMQCCGWNQNSDADGIQAISTAFALDGFVFDWSDGQGGGPIGRVNINNAIFNTVDTPSTQNGTGTIKNGIFKGFSNPTGTNPVNVVSVADNHTVTSGSFHIVGVNWQNLAVENCKTANPPSVTNYFTWGGTETSAVSIGNWTTVVDLQSGATINKPSF